MPSQSPPGSPPGPDVPERVLELSRAAVNLHDPSHAVAVLVADSLLDADVPLPGEARRRLLFQRDDLFVDLTLHHGGAGTDLHVRVVRDLGGDEHAGELEHAGDLEPSSPAAAVVEPAPYDFAELHQSGTQTKIRLTAGEGALTDVPSGLTCLVLPGHVDSVRFTTRTAWFTV